MGERSEGFPRTSSRAREAQLPVWRRSQGPAQGFMPEAQALSEEVSHGEEKEEAVVASEA
jgi:hypothetical protein